MRASRRTVAGIILGILLAALIVTQRRGDDGPAADRDNNATLAAEEAATPRGADPAFPAGRRNPAPAWAAISRELSRDSSDEACVQLVQEATAFAARERATPEPRDTEAYEAMIMAEMARLHRTAADTREPEMLLAALLNWQYEDRKDADASRQAMLLAFGTQAASSSSPVLAWHALRVCADAGQSCPFAHLEQDLLELQRDNAEAWALVAATRYQRRDVAGALAALQGAAGAKTSTWHWPETIVLVERTLATHTSIAFPDSALVAFGAGAVATPPYMAEFNTMCRVESAANRAWAEACLAVGELRQEHNETEMAQGLAYSTRRQALAALGEAERPAEIQAAYERFSAERMAGGQNLMMAGSGLQQALIETSRTRMHAYLGAVSEHGERRGRREFLRKEVPALLERAGLLGREGARECMAEIFLDPRAAGTTRQAVLEHRLQPGDELHMTLRDNGTGTRRSTSFTRRIGPDGKFNLPGGLSIAAAGMTTEQFQRELAAAVSSGSQPPEALVIPIPRRPGEELRSEFENARTP